MCDGSTAPVRLRPNTHVLYAPTRQSKFSTRARPRGRVGACAAGAVTGVARRASPSRVAGPTPDAATLYPINCILGTVHTRFYSVLYVHGYAGTAQ